ncbi:hypothetical protein AMJ85_07730 [candidate division BRC1 bacterium SM23_51]|nr:MAG: hypothetical protein AMJ85_07730 [candidate division BRC1 bacterium SM23_51]
MRRRERSRFAFVVAAVALAACTTGCAMWGLSAAKHVSLQDQLQGQWVFNPEANEFGIQTIAIEGDKLDTRTSMGDYFKGTIKVNETVSPAQVDILVTDSSMADAVDQTALGIVKIEGGKVTLCLDPASGYGRPTAFDSNQGMLMVGEKK